MTIKLIDPTLGQYPITQRFGPSDIDYSAWGLIGHAGIDYGCPSGSPVYASISGTVKKMGYEANGFGNYIRIDDDEGYSIYAHLSNATVVTGQVITQGTMIGRSGNTGNSTGPHLHFERHQNSESKANGYNGAVDPTPYFENAVETPTTGDTAEQTTNKATVIWSALNMRPETNVQTPAIGLVYAGFEIEYNAIIETRGGDGEVEKWLECNLWGRTIYFAAYYGGDWSVSIGKET